ncbi:hypothetical protein [Nocardia sp. R6R-6]|uniref:hypothetical protein n=1 Tax=Nocardia sp. R6R-6 TaxID=3459303 RepID=UPI00403D61B4
MTRPDREHPSQGAGQGNPFDTGLPMLRIPPSKSSKRRPHTRRAAVRRRHAESEAAQPPDEQSPRPRFGEWEQWLDPAPPAEQLPETPVAQQHSAQAQPPAAEQGDGTVPAVINRSGIHPGIPVRHPRRHADQPRGGRSLTVLIVLGIAVATVSIGLTVIYGSETKTRPAATSAAHAAGAAQVTSTSTTRAKPPWAIATPGCEQRRTPDVVSGTDPGGTGNGPDAILAFEYAYYAERSGYRARAVVAPDAAVSPAEQIQRGINQVPAGTRYCVLITRAGDRPAGQERWEVRLAQQFPGEEPNTFTQFITTRTGADQTLITGITAG